MICSADNTTYQLIINISGGDPGTYTVNTLPATANYTSPSIPNGGDYSFVVTDINNCDPVLLEGKEFCACISDAGTMDQNPLDICPGETAIAPENNDTTLEANDVVRYILHDSPTEAIGTIYAWNTAPNFGFGPGMNYGETYYISRIIGDPEPGASAEVDLDECYSMSEGTPVVFRQDPEGVVIVQETPICKKIVYPVNTSS